MSYVTGFLTPVPEANRDAYVESARQAWTFFEKNGCLGSVEAWGEDVPAGEVTDFRRAVKLEDGEVVVFSWLIWPDRKTADDAFARMMGDASLADMQMPFDGKRMMWGGFTPVFEERADSGD